jgi:NitT/TauT family transport system substrate-binding protein
MAFGFATAGAIPLWIALEQGLYQKYGLDVDVTLLQSSAQIAPAMAAGEVDVALTAGAGVVDMALAGSDQVLVVSMQNMMRFYLHAKPEVRRVEDLRGKQAAITRLGSGVHLAMETVLERAGLEPGRDVALVQTGTSGAAVTALATGQFDAAMLAAPDNLHAERQGFPLLADLKDYRVPYSQGSLSTTRAMLAQRYDVVRDFVKGHLEGVAIAKRDEALSVSLLGKHTKSEDQDLLVRGYRMWLEDIDDSPYPDLDAIQTVLNQRAPDNAAARTANPRDFMDDRIVRELEASGFLRQTLGTLAR